jgi:uncharacterized membrane protein (DUF4010 family)
MYGTTAQITNAAAVAAIGAAFLPSKQPFRRNWRYLRHRRLFALSILTCAAFLSWMRRAAA